MVVENVDAPDIAARLRDDILELGFVPYFTPPSLQKVVVENLEADPSH